MKRDELALIMGKEVDVHPKRLAYLYSRWRSKGWLDEALKPTAKMDKLRYLILNKNQIMNGLDRRVAFVEYVSDNLEYATQSGILVDYGDNGWHFYTPKSARAGFSYSFLKPYGYEELAYVEPHPRPRKVWRLCNRAMWDKTRREDFFHKKINTMSPGTVCKYGTGPDARMTFTYTHPLGNMGDCFPCCQCKHLGG